MKYFEEVGALIDRLVELADCNMCNLGSIRFLNERNLLDGRFLGFGL
jgi:hypothetical protein